MLLTLAKINSEYIENFCSVNTDSYGSHAVNKRTLTLLHLRLPLYTHQNFDIVILETLIYSFIYQRVDYFHASSDLFY